jgi:hypothetical protein
MMTGNGYDSLRDNIKTRIEADVVAAFSAILGVSLTTKRGGSEYFAICPFHDDHDPSCRVNQQKGLWRCDPCDIGGDAFDLYAQMQRLDVKTDFPKVLEGLGKLLGVNGTNVAPHGKREIEDVYAYCDETGDLLGEVVRFKNKDFIRRRYGARGEIINNWNFEPPLFRLPGLITAPPSAHVFVVEGEKDVKNLVALGRMIATTSPGGSSSWRPAHTTHFKGRLVVILPDNDKSGRKYAVSVARSILEVAAEVKIVELPGLAEAGDVSDWIEAQRNAGLTTEQIREALIALVKATKPATAETIEELARRDERVERTTNNDEMTFTSARDLLGEAETGREYVVENLLARSGFSALVAKPKVGKSTFARCLSLAVSRGEPFLGLRTTKGPVLYLALEESRRQLRNHFRMLGAIDAENIHIFAGRAPSEAAEAIRQLRAAIEKYEPVLVVIDTLFRLIRVKEVNAYGEVGNSIEPLLAMARELGAHVMFLHHSPKGDPRSAIEAALGSIELAAAVDYIMALRKGEKFRTIIAEGREDEAFAEETTLAFDDKTKSVALGPTKRDADELEAAAAILAWLQTQPESIKEETIIQAVDGRKATKERALRKLCEGACPKVERHGEGKKGAPYTYRIRQVGDGRENPESPKNASETGDIFSPSPSGHREGESEEREILGGSIPPELVTKLVGAWPYIAEREPALYQAIQAAGGAPPLELVERAVAAWEATGT